MLSAGGETVPYRFSFVGRPLPVVRGKTGEYGRLSAGGKTVPYSYCFVGRPLPVLRGKTGEEYRLSASGETLSCRFCFVGRPLPVLQSKTGKKVGLWLAEKRYRTDLVLSAARFQFCEAKLASMVVLLAGGETVPYRF